MELNQYQVDAFASRVFEGNPAAVVPLDAWLPDAMLRAIAQENNLAETAFFVPVEKGFHLRWFTPVAEVDLCGHATLATAHVLISLLGYSEPEIAFQTRSGELRVRSNDGCIEMDFPAQPPVPCVPPAELLAGLGVTPQAVLAADDYLVVLADEAAVAGLQPDMTQLTKLDLRGVIVTAPGNQTDFVSRFFAPKLGVPEDPVTGSAHCELMPYWSGRLGSDSLLARQISPRGGDVQCELKGDRVLLSGRAVTFMTAKIIVPDS